MSVCFIKSKDKTGKNDRKYYQQLMSFKKVFFVILQKF